MVAKTDKLPRSGYYRSKVETTGEFEGSAYSELMDSERTGSDDSGALTRKHMNLNSRKEDAFGVPTQTISLSQCSVSERRDVLCRLRLELDQVRKLRKKYDFQLGADDILSSSSARKGHDMAMCGMSLMSMTTGPAKKASNSDKGRLTAREVNVLSTADTVLMKQCKTLLERLMAQKFGWVFNTPVDVVKLNIPDYLDIIKHPMDLGTVKSKISSGAYSRPLEFAADVRLTFKNAMEYNPKGHDVHFMAQAMSDFFERRWKTIEKKLPTADISPEKLVLCEESVATETSPPKKRKIASFDHKPLPVPVERVMTAEAKDKLGVDLQSFMGEFPAKILDFLKKHCSSAEDDGDDEIEIDMDALGNETLFTLRELLDESMRKKQGEPCEIEMLNESGPSNSSMQHHKGDDPADEDVDIGGNEPPVSSYPPVEIEKDTDYKFKIPISPGESNNSDSSSSSGSESNGSDCASPGNVSKAPKNLESGGQPDEKAPTGDSLDRNECVSGLDQLELSSQPQPSSMDSDFHLDGPAERQVSPDKLIRYALLKNRYSDIILKAQEKTLLQVDKGDPEKLQREREEREQRRKREKARLQAEAKAAEDARRQAEEAAVAEAKRKRELEREAARQALLEMEKTVEINENSRILEDLEILRNAPAEQLPSSGDETSPDTSQDGFGGFRFGGSNPLEQLGLYMKEEEEEDEEAEPQNDANPKPDNDVEEGEID